MRAIIIMACMGMAHAHPHMNDGHVMHDLMMHTKTKNLLLKKTRRNLEQDSRILPLLTGIVLQEEICLFMPSGCLVVLQLGVSLFSIVLYNLPPI